MPANLQLRSVAAGTVAAIVVVGAYALGHAGRAAAAVAGVTKVTAADTATAGAGGISVTGTGRATGTPNLLRLQLAVNVTKPDVSSALAAANAAANAVQKALKAGGVADADLQTSGLSIQPNYDSTSGGWRPNGFQVQQSISAVLRDLPKAGAAITAVVNAGGDAVRIDGASLDIANDTELMNKARDAAFAAAEAKAKAYAKAAGRSLGAVTTISESENTGGPYRMLAAASAAKDIAVPIQAGSQDVSVTVSATWALS
jgi:uncharacterized protein YggE